MMICIITVQRINQSFPNKKLNDFEVTALSKLFAEFGLVTPFVLATSFRKWKYPREIDSLPTVNPTPSGLFDQRWNFLAIWADEFDAELKKHPEIDSTVSGWSIAQQIWDRFIEAEIDKTDFDPEITNEVAVLISKHNGLHEVPA